MLRPQKQPTILIQTPRMTLGMSTLAGLLFLSFGEVAAAAQPRLNVLCIITDQQPVSCVAAYGNHTLKTPNLDRLAAGGCLFTHSYIAAFACSPSRASLLSGRYAHNHGVIRNDVLLEQGVPCAGDLFKAADYDTAYFGKWHLGGNVYRCREAITARKLEGVWFGRKVLGEKDYDVEVVPGGGGDDQPQHGFDTWVGGWAQYRAYLQEVGLGGIIKEQPRTGAHNDAPSGKEGVHIYSLIPQEHHVDAFVAKHAESFIRERASHKRPWLAVVSFFGPHLPVAPPKPWDTMYPLEQVKLPDNHLDDLRGKPAAQRSEPICYVQNRWTEGQFKDYIARYYGYCGFIDNEIGRVLAALDETNQQDRTIVLFTSDHGDMLTAHGLIFKGPGCGYEELYRVPTIVRVPGVTRSGSRSDALVSNVDMLPTLLELAAVPAPSGLDGRSMTKLLKGETSRHRDAVFASCFDSGFVCRDSRYKFVLNSKPRDLDELYDLKVDPGEMHNLAYEPKYGDLAQQKRQNIVDWLKQTGHPYARQMADLPVSRPSL